ncbi:MAG TPA: class I SAM-dependent methyltransferase [Acidimicrobiales bacterium]
MEQVAADGFGRGAEDYERSRPSYPAEAVDLVTDLLDLRPGRRLLDLGAGTGKLTRMLAPSGAEIWAVEPVATMREQLAEAVDGVIVVDGTAESLPLGDGEVDGVVCAQAFHWFDAPASLAEIHRVLRSDGRLALVWNVRDTTTDWVARFGEILVAAAGRKPYEDGTDWAAVVAAAGGFGPLQHRRFTYGQELDAGLLVTRAASTSFVSALPDDEREACLAEVADMAATHPQLAGRETFTFPYLTDVFWCDRA